MLKEPCDRLGRDGMGPLYDFKAPKHHSPMRPSVTGSTLQVRTNLVGRHERTRKPMMGPMTMCTMFHGQSF